MDGDVEPGSHDEALARVRANGGCTGRGLLKTVGDDGAKTQEEYTEDAVARIARSGHEPSPGDILNAERFGAALGRTFGQLTGVIETIDFCVTDGENKRKAVADTLEAKRRIVAESLHSKP